MKLLLVFAFFALVCMARSAPPSTTSRLILPDYNDGDEEIISDITNDNHDENQENADEDDEDDTTTTTTTTTRRSPYVPTRNRDRIPTRRPILTYRPTTQRTTTTTTADAYDDEENTDNNNNYDGDYKYVRDFRKYIQKLLEDIRKLVRNLTGYDFVNNQANQQYSYQYNNNNDH